MADTGGRVDPSDGDGGFATPATTIAQRLSRQQRGYQLVVSTQVALPATVIEMPR